jgi:hypothetical protein
VQVAAAADSLNRADGAVYQPDGEQVRRPAGKVHSQKRLVLRNRIFVIQHRGADMPGLMRRLQQRNAQSVCN